MKQIFQTGADLLIDRLHQWGIRHLFGMPGSHSLAIYDALYRSGSIGSILIRNEQAGAYCADGYARASGQPGVICTTAGPGATNALSGIAEAFSDGSPVLLLTGQVNHDKLDREYGNYHEIDLEGIFRPCTRFVKTITSLEEIPSSVDTAFLAMLNGRPRSAALILPQDLMAKKLTSNDQERIDNQITAIPTITSRDQLVPEQTEIQKALKLILSMEHPVIVAGGGAIWSDAGAAILQLSEQLHCPIVTTLNGKGIVDERHPFALGHARTKSGWQALSEADGMIAIGCRFTEVFTWFDTLPIPNKRLQIDIDLASIGVRFPIDLGLIGDARNITQILCLELSQNRFPYQSSWQSFFAKPKTALTEPEWIIESLRQILPEDAIIYSDASEMAIRFQTDFPVYRPRSLFYPSTYIALGWGFPAAIGGAIACPDRTIVSFSGDGGFTMTAQELSTAVRYRLRIIIIVHNDQSYGAIRHQQRMKCEGRYLDTELNNPDFLRLAEAYGVPAFRTSEKNAFRSVVRDALNRQGPTLIEVPDEWRWLRS